MLYGPTEQLLTFSQISNMLERLAPLVAADLVKRSTVITLHPAPTSTAEEEVEHSSEVLDALDGLPKWKFCDNCAQDLVQELSDWDYQVEPKAELGHSRAYHCYCVNCYAPLRSKLLPDAVQARARGITTYLHHKNSWRYPAQLYEAYHVLESVSLEVFNQMMAAPEGRVALSYVEELIQALEMAIPKFLEQGPTEPRFHPMQEMHSYYEQDVYIPLCSPGYGSRW